MTHLLTTARARFEAARSLPGASDGRLCGRHGHGFVVDVAARSTYASADPEGSADAVGILSRSLQQAVASYDYADLNTQYADPSDEGLAVAIATSLSAFDLSRVVVAPTPFRRVEWTAQQGVIHAYRYAFEAAHFLPNVPEGHKCGRLHGHSFEVLIRARVDGAAIDAAWAPLGARLTYDCLNDIEGLSNPTSECLAQWLWVQLQPSLVGLQTVTVYETGRCGATYDGQRHSIWRAFTFDAAVQIEGAAATDPRRRTHGHTYRLRLHLSAPLDPVLGWALDFADVQRLFAPIYDALDHRPLSALPGLASQRTPAVAQWIRAEAAALLPALTRIDLEETVGNGVVLAWGADEPFPV